MRDVDLVVSVAHVWGVDPETSHSTIEMRAVILSETLKLFKIKNVEIKQNNAIIKWELWEYSHLWSWVCTPSFEMIYFYFACTFTTQMKNIFTICRWWSKTAEIISKKFTFSKRFWNSRSNYFRTNKR